MSILADGRSAFLALRPQIHFSLPGHPFPILAMVGAAPILPRTEAPRSAAAPAFVDKGAFAHGRFRTDAAGGPSPAWFASAGACRRAGLRGGGGLGGPADRQSVWEGTRGAVRSHLRGRRHNKKKKQT